MVSEQYNFTFTWPNGPQSVILTGDFDNWTQSTPLIKLPSGTFEVSLPIIFNNTDDINDEKFYFKFVVDGQWLINDNFPVEHNDSSKPENNFITLKDIQTVVDAATTQQKNEEQTEATPPIQEPLFTATPLSESRPYTPLITTVSIPTSATSSAVDSQDPNYKKKKYKIKKIYKINRKSGEKILVSEEKILATEDSNQINGLKDINDNIDSNCINKSTKILSNPNNPISCPPDKLEPVTQSGLQDLKEEVDPSCINKSEKLTTDEPHSCASSEKFPVEQDGLQDLREEDPSCLAKPNHSTFDTTEESSRDVHLVNLETNGNNGNAMDAPTATKNVTPGSKLFEISNNDREEEEEDENMNMNRNEDENENVCDAQHEQDENKQKVDSEANKAEVSDDKKVKAEEGMAHHKQGAHKGPSLLKKFKKIFK